MKEDAKILLDEAKNNLIIGEIHLNESHIKSSDSLINNDLDGFISEYYRRPVSREIAQVEETINQDAPKYRYRFIFATGIRIKDKGKSDDPLLSIEARFRVEYYSFEEVSNDALDAFSEDHIAYHLWPFWREYVQSTCSRLGIRPISVPLYQINK